MTQSFNAPDSISADELNELLAAAQPEEDPQQSEAQARVEHLCNIAEAACDMDHLDGTDAAMVHKIMMINLAKQFLMFHNLAHHRVISQNPTDERVQACAAAWSRDAGKFQTILALLDTIEITDEDFTVPVAK